MRGNKVVLLGQRHGILSDDLEGFFVDLSKNWKPFTMD